MEVVGRSLVWKVCRHLIICGLIKFILLQFFLIADEPLKSTSNVVKPETLLRSLQSSRKRYADLLSQKMIAPDGSYPEGFMVSGSSNPSPRRDNPFLDLERNNPLSLHNDVRLISRSIIYTRLMRPLHRTLGQNGSLLKSSGR